MKAGLIRNLLPPAVRSTLRAGMVALLLCGKIFAQEAPVSGLGALESHPHTPIFVRSRPVIERLAVAVVDPTDICTTAGGDLLIADAAAETVIRLSDSGDSTIVARRMAGVIRLHSDEDNNVFALRVDAHTTLVEQITTSGKHATLCSIPSAAVGFTRDSVGEMTIACGNGELWRVTTDNAATRFARLGTAIIDVALSSSEQLQVLTEDARVLLVSAEGQVRAVQYAHAGSNRLFALPEGNLATLCPTAGSRPMIAEVTRERSATAVVFAYVPAGTTGVAFDRLGNLSLANPDLRAITRVTSRFRVPCPHCNREVDMILSPDAPQSSGTARSF